ncbi:hypothetical protein E2562_001259 [Oryza meyeriana var. granulata]|uniref:Uncharacterized protein n=1 Tax=Oryza meyeriana var. granulata TaxID=110450 RepID=A0A6G1DC28_9ORYZ|nr:hypothetical protein E2562_001259 [Oryza meyeriana var. granulata]
MDMRCNNPEKGIKCSHVKFRKNGPKFLEDMHIIFGKAHVDGSTAACPGDISSNDTSDEDVAEVAKPTKEKEKAVNQGKRKRKAVEEKEEKSPFYRMYKNTCLKIETAAERISTSVEASSATTINPIPTIAEAVKMVKECGVEEGTALIWKL